MSLVTSHDIYVASRSYVDLPVAGDAIYPIVEKFELGFISTAVHDTEKIGAFPKIILLIHFSLHVQELFHGKAYRSAVIMCANFFFDVILLSVGIINNILLDKRGILQIEWISVWVTVGVAIPVVEGVTCCVSC